MRWYRLETRAVLEQLASSENGLSEPEARQRLEKFGPNKLAECEEISRLRILLHQFTSPLLLGIAAITMSLCTGYYLVKQKQKPDDSAAEHTK